MRGINLELFSQPADIDINRTWRDERSFFPYRVEQLIAGQHTSAVDRQVLQQTKLAHRGDNITSLRLNRHGRSVDFEIAQAQHFAGRGRLTHSAQHAAHSGYQFARTEGFADVVVSAQLEALYAVDLCRL